MILPDLTIPSRINQRLKYSGIDTLEWCYDQEHFLNYPHSIEYVYNSRGFRDKEWPVSLTELQEAVWCVGDSFTAGIGQPLEHIWPNVLAKRINQRSINVSMDGASNDWICRRACDIANTINPKIIVIMWSYIHRQENSNNQLDDEQRRIYASKQSQSQEIQQWLVLVDRVRNIANKVVQLSIPDFMLKQIPDIWQSIKDPSWPCCPKTLQDLENLPSWIRKELKESHSAYDHIKSLLILNEPYVRLPEEIIYIDKRLDWARDYHHFDILTSQWVVDQIEDRLRT